MMILRPDQVVVDMDKRLSKDQCAMLGRQRGESVVPVNRQVAIANLVYSGRMGNKAAGDGWNTAGVEFRRSPGWIITAPAAPL
ncbi:hypothetical protein [Serratia fonticola]